MPEGSRGSFHDVPMDDDSPRHSTASIGSSERAPSTTPSDGSDPPSADPQRPLSLVSTLSSGSASSRDDCQAPPPTGASSPTPSGEDIDLEPVEDNVRKRRGFRSDRNDNGSAASPSRNAFRRPAKVAKPCDAMAPSPTLSYVDRVVMEIIETERMYVQDLRMIVEDYLAHIIDHTDLSVGPELVCALFGNIEDIYEFNSELLQSLDRCDNDPVAVARCFVVKSEYFDIYTQYCTNYPNSVAALTECMRNKSLAKFFRERQASLKRSLPLGSYLLKPVQRILKYHLLLQEIAKHSDQQGAEYDVVEEAIYTMTGVAWYINEMKRRHEHAVRLQEVQSLLLNWKGPDLTTYGELVLEGTFKVHRAKSERTLFLFDRLLLITKRRGEHYAYKANISCSTLMLIESAKDSLSFSVTHYKHPKQSHTVQARNLDEKKLWSHHIKRIILENHQAIIPQKAKEAILEMDSIYPSKYRYSPDRLKKTMSIQTEELQSKRCAGRRQSEPIKQQFEGSKAVLKDEEIRSIVKDKNHHRLSVVEEPPEELQQSSPEKNSESEENDVHSNTSSMISASPSGNRSVKKSAPPPPPSTPPAPAAPPPPQTAEPAVGTENTEEASSATQDSDSKTLSSDESSEEEENGEVVKGSKAKSILPTSVLSRAGAIAQHFQGSRRPSLASDDPCSPISPRLPSRANSVHGLKSTSPCSDHSEVFRPADPNMLSPRDEDGPGGRGVSQRRDSTLSKSDQLLIGKIKSYYEVAESQDPTFCLRRRESLTSIPTGLVRSSVSRFNCGPADKARRPGEGVHVKPSLSASAAATNAAAAVADNGIQAKPGRADSGDQGGINMKAVSYPQQGSAVVVGGSVGYSSALATAPVLQEEFRSSSEMIQIWQAMEQDLSRTSVRRRAETPGSVRIPREAGPGVTGALAPNPGALAPNAPANVGENGGSELATITEETAVLTKPRTRTTGPTGRGTGSLRETLKLWGGEGPVQRPPRVLELRGQTQGPPVRVQENDSQDDLDSAKSKVLSLARQYSQRIKTSKPPVRLQGPDPRLGKRTLACVVEESETASKPSLVVPLAPVPTAPERPAGPSTTEEFSWPDVRELRSKYGPSEGPLVGRSLSVPERMAAGGPNRRSNSTSSSTSPLLPLAEGGAGADSVFQPAEEGKSRANRTKSLDQRLSGLQLNRLEKLPEEAPNGGFHGYYVSGEAALPGDEGRKIVVMEKLPAEPPGGSVEPVEPAGKEEVHVHSPTGRDKTSIKAVIDRCKAYQESEEYKLREEAADKAEAGVGGGGGKGGELDNASTEVAVPEPGTQQNSMVKNLRERFQKM